MTGTKAYSSPVCSRRMNVAFIRRIFIIATALLLLFPSLSLAQDEPEYDELTVFLEIPRIGGGELPAVIKGEEAYLSITDLFDYLKIKNDPAMDLETITGFFIAPEATYIIDRANNRITYQDKSFDLRPGDLVRSETGLYLRSDYFGKIFGLDCKFNFRSLSVRLDTRLELPLMREMRQEALRQNISRLKGEIRADTAIGRTYPGFRFGMADWSVIANEQIKGVSSARVNLKLGTVIAGGEAMVNLNYYSGDPFTEKQQNYLWRYVNNENSLWRQISAGKIITGATSSLFNPVVGAQITNTPTTFRRSFGSYTLSDKTNPGWVVELYVNNVLVDYVKADASGFYTFEVPLVYGNSMVKLKFYGPWGEEDSQEQNINIPFNFLPHKTLEYKISAGMVEDTLHSVFSRGSVGYGLTPALTVGGGVEYLSSVTSGPVMPYITSSLRITKNLLASAEFTYGVRAKGTLSYRLPSNIQFDLNYTRYDRNQTAINYNYLEERKATISLPIQAKRFFAYSRFTYYQIVLPTTNYTTGEWLLSGSFFGVNTNLTTYVLFIGEAEPNVYSNISFSFRLPGNFTLIPQAQYGYTQNKLMTAKIGIEKHLPGNGFLNMSFERNFRSNLTMGEIGLRYDFSYAQVGASFRQSNKATTLVQYARGSLINDSRTKYVRADNRTNVGMGGITILPYLDINANKKYDAGEPKASGLNVQASGGRVIVSNRDTTIRILNLEPYTKYFIELSESGFENIAWKIRNKTLSVAIDPNQLKIVEVPVSVAGEATGNVTLEKDGGQYGIGRITVNFYRLTNKLAGRTLTEQDGFYSLFGLAPGSYYARIDTIQLRRLKLTATPDSLFFKIKPELEGDIIDGLDFVLRKKVTDTVVAAADTAMARDVIEKLVKKDTTYLIVHEVTREEVSIREDYFAIQTGAFLRKSNAYALQKKLAAVLDKKVEVIMEDGYYKVRVTGFTDREELNGYVPVLQSLGINEMWVITSRAKKEWLTTARRDSLARISETVTERPLHVITSDLTIQAGAFIDEKNAITLRDRLASTVDKPVAIVFEDGYYKVRITDFTDVGEMIGALPALKDLGFKDIWVIYPEKKPEPVIEEADSAFVAPPLIIPRDTVIKIETPEVREEPVVELPRFVLHAAVYYKQYQAIRAQRKISRKLGLPVEIIKDWDAYRVVVTGFYTREETYQFYPELAGMGYFNVFVIERSPQKK